MKKRDKARQNKQKQRDARLRRRRHEERFGVDAVERTERTERTERALVDERVARELARPPRPDGSFMEPPGGQPLGADLEEAWRSERTSSQRMSSSRDLEVRGLRTEATTVPAADAADPTDDEWRRLFDAAVACRNLAPRHGLLDGEIVGLVDPETGETHYACVLGGLGLGGEVTALALYLGAEGFECLDRILADELQSEELPYVQPCLMASFGDRLDLEAEDRRLIKRLGLRFRGRGAWPQFRHRKPGWQPWPVSGPQARLLTRALERVTDVARRLSAETLELPGVEFLLVCAPRDVGGRIEWEHRTEPDPTGVALADEQPARIDVDRVLRLAASGSATDEAWQFECLPMTQFVGERGERGQLIRALLWADATTGVALHVQVSFAKTAIDKAADETLQLFERSGRWPASIEVRRPAALSALEPLAEALGFELIPTDALPAIDAITEASVDEMGLG